MNVYDQRGLAIQYNAKVALSEIEQLDGIAFTMNLTWNDGQCRNMTDAFTTMGNPPYPSWNPSGANMIGFRLKYTGDKIGQDALFQILLNDAPLNVYGANNNILVTSSGMGDTTLFYFKKRLLGDDKSWISTQIISKVTGGVLCVQNFGDWYPIRADANQSDPCYKAEFLAINNSPQIVIYNSVVPNLNKCCDNSSQSTDFRNMCSKLLYTQDSPNCRDALVSYCGKNNNIINDPACKTFCQKKDSDCDNILTNYCSSLTPDQAAKDSKCGCFRGKTVYDNYFRDLGLKTNIDVTTHDPDCAFPDCSGSEYKQYNWKQNTYCPDTQICVNAVTIDNSGNITGNIDIKTSNQCSNVKVNPDVPIPKQLTDYMNSSDYYKDYANIDKMKLNAAVNEISAIVLNDKTCSKDITSAKSCADNFPAQCNIKDVATYRGFDCSKVVKSGPPPPVDDLTKQLTDYVMSSDFIKDMPNIDKNKLSLYSHDIVTAVLSTSGCETDINSAKTCANQILNDCSSKPEIPVVNNFGCDKIRLSPKPSGGGGNKNWMIGVGIAVVVIFVIGFMMRKKK